MCEESEFRWHELDVARNSWLTGCKSQGTIATLYWAHSFSNIPEMEKSSTIHTLLVHRCIWKSSLDDVVKQFEKRVFYGIISVIYDTCWDVVPWMRLLRYRRVGLIPVFTRHWQEMVHTDGTSTTLHYWISAVKRKYLCFRRRLTSRSTWTGSTEKIVKSAIFINCDRYWAVA